MTAKCAYCGGALKFDADIQMLVCEHCSGMFPVEKTEAEKMLSDPPEDMTGAADFRDSAAIDEMECRVYHCTSCGAELMINNVEAATYCAYCGQPTIVFDRIAMRRRPNYIIPFSVTKNVALVNIREKFLKGGFIPNEIKYFNPDFLRGIYVPYMLYDVRCRAKALIRYSVPDSNSSSSTVKHCYRDAGAVFTEIPVDASTQISNEFSERLEPYYQNSMAKFKVEYLSGFYADLKDDDFPNLARIIKNRTADMLNEQIISTVPGQTKTLLNSKFSYTFEKEAYALFPVWFMQFHKDEKTYTIMVNGQTGKVVGAIPADKKKFFLFFSLLAMLFSTLFFFLFPMLWLAHNPSIPITLTLCIPALIIGGFRKMRGLSTSQRFTTGKHIKKFVKERQDS